MGEPKTNADRPQASLEKLKMRYGFRSEATADPQVIHIKGPKDERWERVVKGLYVMVNP